MKDALRQRIAGEIVFSGEPGKTIRKWRETFHIQAQELSRHLSISPSVISDYESGRRRSPGTATIRRFVDALIEMDMKRGGSIVSRFTGEDVSEAVIQIKELHKGMGAKDFLRVIRGKAVSDISLDRDIHGYTVIDSLKAIMTINARDYLKIYGWSSERALIFTGVQYGRSPMIAVRTHLLKPAMVVYHNPEKIDPLAVKLSELENIPLVVTKITLKQLIKNLGEIGGFE